MDCGAERIGTSLEPLFSVMLFKVTLKARTEGSGASSPVTNTEAGWPLCGPIEEELPPPQPIVIAVKNNRQKPLHEQLPSTGEWSQLAVSVRWVQTQPVVRSCGLLGNQFFGCFPLQARVLAKSSLSG